MLKNILSLFLFICHAVAFAQLGSWKYQVVTDSLYSESLGAWRSYRVLLPPGFDKNNREYPVLYLLHGMSDDHRCWVEKGRVTDVADRLLSAKEMKPMVIVTPCAGGEDLKRDWNGYFNMEGWAYETFFFQEFVPYIENTYRCGRKKEQRAIAGLSMGGGGCTSYAQRYSEMFCAAYAMSAFLHNQAPHQSPKGKVDLLMKSAYDNSCLLYVKDADEERKRKLRTVEWFVDCGDDDFLLENNMDFYRAMRKAGIPCQFRIRDGGHDWEYWHSALYLCLPFVSRCMQ